MKWFIPRAHRMDTFKVGIHRLHAGALESHRCWTQRSQRVFSRARPPVDPRGERPIFRREEASYQKAAIQPALPEQEGRAPVRGTKQLILGRTFTRLA